ncbi:MAG TPA: PKD domain-containing protein, partial [Thermoplasmata archaeon]|nr:PKD domain-containing protein [Thermoplasmata archaeon]
VTVVPDVPPVADFFWYPQVPAVNQTVFFNAGFYSYDPDGYIVSWNWSFGDGTSGGGGNRSGNFSDGGPFPTHAYATFGDFVVTLNVTDNAGLSASVSKTIHVNAPPVAAFTISTGIGKIGTPVFFDASASRDPDGDPLNYSWSFGDGSYATGKIVSHVFATQGQYLIVLVVSDPYTGVSTSTYLAVVPPKSPTAVIAWTPPRPIAGQTSVEFNGSNSFDPDGAITRYIWEFGDGVVGSGLTATHVYADAGTYTIELIVVDEDGVANRDTQTMTVLARSKAVVTAANLQTPIAGAQVSLSQGGSVVLDILTASDGGFSLGDLAPGTYAIAISKAGFEAYRGTLAWDGLNGDLGTFVLTPLSTQGGPVGVLSSAWLAGISLGAGAGIGVALYLFRKRRPRSPRSRAD